MPIRNPFAKREPVIDETVRPGSSGGGFEKADTLGSRGSSALSIGRSKKNEEENLYKMSVVNDGVYLPPSPPEKKSFFSRRSQPSSNTRNNREHPTLPPIEPFSISRESFDSYRRSFDISARTPIPLSHNNSASSTDFPSAHGRQSLDARLPRYPTSRSSLAIERPFDAQTPQEEKDDEVFEDVTLGDGRERTPAVAPKRGFFARIGEKSLDGMGPVERTTSKEDVPLTSRFHFGIGGDKARKRGQSGTGQELGAMERPAVAPEKGREVESVR